MDMHGSVLMAEGSFTVLCDTEESVEKGDVVPLQEENQDQVCVEIQGEGLEWWV